MPDTRSATVGANIVGLFLAAGRGQRFGSNKLLHAIGGQSLVSHGLRAVLASKLDEVRAVVGPGQDPVKAALCESFTNADGLTYVANPKPELGMMSSLQTGIRTLRPTTDGAMLFLGDMPSMSPAIINQILERFEKGRIVVPSCRGRLTHPRILPKELFAEFLDLAPGVSGQDVLKRHADRILKVPFLDESCFRDVDRPEDLS